MRILKGILVLGFGLLAVYHFGWGTSSYSYHNGDIKIYTYTRQFCNLHIVQKGERYLMIDAGLPGDSARLMSFLNEQGISPQNIEYLILTHAHPDHAGNAAFLQKHFGTKVIAGAGDLSIITKQGLDDRLCPRGWQGALMNRLIASKRYEVFQPDILVDQSMDLKQINWEGRLEVFKSHTAGSLVLFIDNLAFVGDLIKGKNLHRHRPTHHIFMCDLEQNMRDISAVADYKKINRWFLGHGGPLGREEVVEFIKEQSL